MKIRPYLWAAAYLLLRLPGLLALPIFCDESIYLRYAQLIRRAPLSRAFLSVVDPKPPLHYWLLALVFPTTADPLLAARLLSVLAGVASVLLLFPLCRELARLRRDGSPLTPVGRSLRDARPPVAADAEESGGRPPVPPRSRRERGQNGEASFLAAACALFIACPFLAFYQRMALAESLLVLESLLVAWLSMRWAASARESMGRFARKTLALGLALGAAVLTKQNFSYVLFGLPILAAVLRRSRNFQPPVGRLAVGFLAICVLSALLLLPYLLVEPGPSMRDRLFYRATHGDFGGGIASHARIAWDNLRYVFVPMTVTRVDPVRYEGFDAPADAGWLWTYLTPPVFLFGVAGMVALALRKETRLLGFLGGWTLLVLLPFVPFAVVAVPRYALVSVPPMILAAADLMSRLARRIRMLAAGRVPGAAAAAVAGTLLLAWPLLSIADQDFRWDRQRLVRSDRWQYVSGWPCGLASRHAADFLHALAARSPIVVITTDALGTPNDVVWTYLDGEPNLFLFFAPWALERPILRPAPGRPDRLLLDSGLHDLWYRKQILTIRPDVPVLFVSMDPYPRPDGATDRAEDLLRPNNPMLRELARFSNPPMGLSHSPDSVVIYRLREGGRGSL